MRSGGGEKWQRPAFVDIERGRFLYSGTFFDLMEEHRDYDFKALARLRGHVQQGPERQGSLFYLKTPKQPDPMGCGACVLIMIELMASEGVVVFYLVNRQREDQRAGSPLSERRAASALREPSTLAVK